MRARTIAFSLAALWIGLSLRATAEGAYTIVSAPDDTACAELCATDSLCMAWTRTSEQCGLWANAPAAPTGPFGLSPRAPVFARAQRPAAAPEPTHTQAPHSLRTAVGADQLLLGGPLETADLRPRLGNQN